MNKILHVSTFLPSQNGYAAGNRNSYFNIKKLHDKKGNDLTLILLLNVKPSKTEIKKIEQISHRYIIKKTNMFDKFISKIVFLQNYIFFSRGIFIFFSLKNHINKNYYNQINLEFSQCFLLADHIKKNTNSKLCLYVHDLFTQKMSRILNDLCLKNFLLRYFINTESRLFNQADNIFFPSKKDLKICKRVLLVNNNKTHLDLYKIHLSDFLYKINKKNKKDKFSILFWGSNERPENYKAVIYFIDNIFNLILKQYPSCKLYIVGRLPHTNLLKQVGKNIIVTGFVKDPSFFFETFLS